MKELILAAFDPVNIGYTFFLILVLFYWVSIIFGAMDLNSIDFDIDTDVDFDVDADLDVNSEMGIDGSGGSWLVSSLQFFHFGKLPIMIILSLVILMSWAISILANYYLGQGSTLFALALFFPNLFISLCLTKVITTPLVPLFKNMEHQEEEMDYIGMPCTILLPASTNRMGQAQVMVDDNPLLINVKLDDQTLNLEKGAEALIVGKASDKNCFLIKSEVP